MRRNRPIRLQKYLIRSFSHSLPKKVAGNIPAAGGPGSYDQPVFLVCIISYIRQKCNTFFEKMHFLYHPILVYASIDVITNFLIISLPFIFTPRCRYHQVPVKQFMWVQVPSSAPKKFDNLRQKVVEFFSKTEGLGM